MLVRWSVSDVHRNLFAIKVMREARLQMRQWMNGRQTNYERTVLTQYGFTYDCN